MSRSPWRRHRGSQLGVPPIAKWIVVVVAAGRYGVVPVAGATGPRAALDPGSQCGHVAPPSERH